MAEYNYCQNSNNQKGDIT